MLQIYKSSGNLLSPTAPVAGLAGLPILRIPRNYSGLGAAPVAAVYDRRIRVARVPRFPRRGLGDARSTQQINTGVDLAGTAASVGLTIAGAASAIPIVGIAVAGVTALLSLFHVGQGCGQACITSAATEQIFEVAGWDVELAATAGMITQAQAVAALQWLLQQGQSIMQSLKQTDSKAGDGLTNLTNTLNTQIGAVQANNLNASDFSGSAGPSATPNNAIPVSAPTVALNPTTLENSIFVQPGAAGWYGNSVSQGASLALQAIADVTGVTSASGGTSAGAGTVNILGTSFSTTTILLLLGALGLGWYLFGGK